MSLCHVASDVTGAQQAQEVPAPTEKDGWGCDTTWNRLTDRRTDRQTDRQTDRPADLTNLRQYGSRSRSIGVVIHTL